jgi:predicted RNA polymerase sigma factor
MDEIARAFLTSEATIAQRIVRAKKAIARGRPDLRGAARPERAARLASVLEVIYLIFNEGYAATAGEDLDPPSLCAEAQRLGRILAGLMPGRTSPKCSACWPDGDPGVAPAMRAPARTAPSFRSPSRTAPAGTSC